MAVSHFLLAVDRFCKTQVESFCNNELLLSVKLSIINWLFSDHDYHQRQITKNRIINQRFNTVAFRVRVLINSQTLTKLTSIDLFMGKKSQKKKSQQNVVEPQKKESLIDKLKFMQKTKPIQKSQNSSASQIKTKVQVPPSTSLNGHHMHQKTIDAEMPSFFMKVQELVANNSGQNQQQLQKRHLTVTEQNSEKNGAKYESWGAQEKKPEWDFVEGQSSSEEEVCRFDFS